VISRKASLNDSEGRSVSQSSVHLSIIIHIVDCAAFSLSGEGLDRLACIGANRGVDDAVARLGRGILGLDGAFRVASPSGRPEDTLMEINADYTRPFHEVTSVAREA
jgi:hypothetical protein